MWAYIPNLVGRANLKELDLRKHINPTFALCRPQIATSIYTVLDKTMIGIITGIEEEVTYYEQVQKIIKIILALVTALGSAMMPRVTNLFKQNEMTTVNHYLYKLFRFMFFGISNDVWTDGS